MKYRLDMPHMRRPGLQLLIGGVAALVCLGALYMAHADERDACRMQVLDSEQRIRDALYEANQASGDKVAALIKALRVAP